jgi:hypothetical protein
MGGRPGLGLRLPQFLAHADVLDPGLGEQVAVGGITELLAEATSVRLRMQFDRGQPAFRRSLLDRVHGQPAQARTAGGLADRETAECPGGLCSLARRPASQKS